MYLLLYIDDMLIASRSMEVVERLKRALLSEFEMKDLGPALKILGMRFAEIMQRSAPFVIRKVCPKIFKEA